jgi:non-homologous end joining protein Ku
VRAPEPADTNVIDLMSALKKSLNSKRETTTRAAASKKATSARRAKG